MNLWICIYLKIMNPDLKRFGLYRNHESSQLSKDSTCVYESNESSQILSTKAQKESLKINIPESLWIQASGLANPDPKDYIRGFVLEKKTKITRFVLIRKDW